MRPTYQQELAALADTYAATRDWDRSLLDATIARFSSGPAGFIASGGMTAVASLAAALHEHASLQPGLALTPLAALSRPPLDPSAAMLLTASGKHPDAIEVMRRLGRPGLRPAAVLTHRPPDALPDLPETAVISLPPLSLREGFLAVNSILSMAVGLIGAYLGDVLPARLPRPARQPALPLSVDRIVVLHAPDLAPVAVDLEARLSEIGLAAVQVADYRNFAHGRHTGLDRNLGRTTVLALSGQQSASLATATLKALPDRARTVHWHEDRPWPHSVLALLQTSMQACGDLGDHQHVNVARPSVPLFGRRLYRLSIRRRVPETLAGPIDRKLTAAGPGRGSESARNAYARALDRWLTDSHDQRFGAVVLDHDGTACWTHRRFDPPAAALADALDRTLRHGLRIGFASGRGPSLQRDLRAVLDPELWSRVELGFYNGAVLCRLDEEIGDLKHPGPAISAAVDRLRRLPVADMLELEPRCAQLTVGLAAGAWMPAGRLATLVTESLSTLPALGVKVVGSGHSVDIVSRRATKTAVVDRIRHLDGPVGVVCIGDQGQLGGNDYELLAHDRWSLSVDQCSSDPSRCWYLDAGRRGGPDLTVRYLDALKPARASGAQLKATGLL